MLHNARIAQLLGMRRTYYIDILKKEIDHVFNIGPNIYSTYSFHLMEMAF